MPLRPVANPAFTAALAEAAASIARLDEAVAVHPLRPAFLYRVRLEAVRRQAAVDGRLIDPWHLAALIEGLRLRMDGALRIIDRGSIFEAARYALALHQWLTAPDFDEEGDVRRAEVHLAGYGGRGETPLLTAAFAMHAGWRRRRSPADSRRSGPPLDPASPPPDARAAHRRRGAAGRDTLGAGGLGAGISARPRRRSGGRAAASGRSGARLVRGARGGGRTPAGLPRRRAVDLLAATPLVSATSLAAGLGIAVKNAIALLDGLVAAGIAVEVTHRAKRRLFGLAGMAPLRDGVAAPRRPEPGAAGAARR